MRTDLVRLVHIGDLHLAPGPRNVDRLRALDQIIEENVHDPALGAWLVPGDLNHGRMTIEDRNALATRLQRMAQVAPVLGCDGNHDAPGDLAIFARLQAAHAIRFDASPTTYRQRLATGHDALVAVLPYPHKAALVAAGISPADLSMVAVDPLEAICRSLGLALTAGAARGELPIFIGHVNIAGAQMATGQPNIGKEIELTAPALALLGAQTYKGVNHIHVAQDVSGATYPGSVCRLDWGETDPKGYVVVETPVRAGEPATWRVQRRPLDVAPMYHVEGTLTREAFAYTVTDGPAGEARARPATWQGAEVRVRYRYAKGEHSVLDKARVHVEFAEALRLEVEPIAMPDTGLRSPAVAEARTLAQKAEAWAAGNGQPLTEGARAVLASLQILDPPTMLSDLATTLQALEHEPDQQAVPA